MDSLGQRSKVIRAENDHDCIAGGFTGRVPSPIM